MEALVVLLLLYLFLALVVFPIWAIAKISELNRLGEHARERLRDLTAELADLKRKGVAAPEVPAAVVVPPTPAPPPPAPAPALTPAIVAPTPPPSPVAPPVAPATEFIPPPASTPLPLAAATPAPAIAAPAGGSTPPLLPPETPRPVYTPPAPTATDSINWEQFMGAKLFAWLGGLALFLGVAFFVKYSFDHGWIPPEVRVALGFVFGAGLIVGGLRINRERYAITAQTLIATGVVSLYAVTFACRSIYHFEFFGVIPTFLLMALITTTAFTLAVRLRAQVVALLGMLGGFLTPVLLSTGVDNPAGLFGYLALLDAGLVAVALATGWAYLVPLSAAGTALMMMGWADKFFSAEKGPTAMIVTLGFSALYLVAAAVARRRGADRPPFALTAIAMPLVGFGFALFFLGYAGVAGHAPLYLGYVLLLDAMLLRLAWTEEDWPRLHLLAGGLTFALLAGWTTRHLTDASLPWALAFYLGFAALHTVFPQVLQRRRPESTPGWGAQLFPPLALLLVMLPILRLDAVPFLIWPAILLIDVLAIGLAAATASLLTVGVVLILTLVATAACLFRVPLNTGLDLGVLLAVGGFGVFFFAASCWLTRRLGDALPAEPAAGLNRLLGDSRAQLPAFSALLPFLLLIMVVARLAVPDPSMVFGLALLLVILTLGLARILLVEWLPLCALAGVVALQFAWQGRHLDGTAAGIPLAWHLGFLAIFTVFPFLFRRDFARMTGPWAVAALAGIAHFPLVYRLVDRAWPNDVMGLLPLAFALPPLVSLALVLKSVPADEPKRLNQLAWFGGVGLLFITLIFPIQFERQWLTIAWALEGAALLWLFHRVPHPALRATGVILLVVAFARLALNSAVLSYHLRGDTPILNWYLYTYGLVIAALAAGTRLLAPPRDRVLGWNGPGLLATLAVILSFLLLNIEIADYFTAPGARALAFRFSGHFGRDMTYTIAWSLFALGLLVAGIWRRQRFARYAALALLGVALFKLFFHDLARLQALYRIGALFAVAVIAIVASFAYQRFLPSHDKTSPPAA